MPIEVRTSDGTCWKVLDSDGTIENIWRSISQHEAIEVQPPDAVRARVSFNPDNVVAVLEPRDS